MEKQIVELMKGWNLELTQVGEFEIVNRAEDGSRRFYRIVPGPYSPIIEEEPELAFPLGIGDYVDARGVHAAPQMKVKGVIVKKQAGQPDVLYRGNLSNFFGKDGGKVEEDGKFVVVSGQRYRLYRLLAENKPRMIGYIGFYKPESDHDGSPVQIVESADLA